MIQLPTDQLTLYPTSISVTERHDSESCGRSAVAWKAGRMIGERTGQILWCIQKMMHPTIP